ncbi:Lon protease family protein [Thiopseudomonas denitrificans]|uniref:endopeptidase La n=1 Tax=Thiopseudomonas denitrificans TaxID=1501432 RepID=A0A4R6TZU9_9GAMM|nr:AAA family ATPase [Thiopseudomonas denitrificans]TDQ38432.1 putative ATP-dependent protease [Thiopseudomonas denitrificans]
MSDSMLQQLRLPAASLTRSLPEEMFPFGRTDELEPFSGVLGQTRAVEALEFGVAMPRSGYNVFVMGEPGSGRFSYVRRYLDEVARQAHTPSDWLYVNHFDEPREPHAIELPAGMGSEFCRDISGLLDTILSAFPAVFETPSWQQKKSAIDRAFNKKYDKALDRIEKLALEKNIALYRDSSNIAFTPMFEGRALDEAEFAQRPESEREQFHADIAWLEEQLNTELSSLPLWKRESSNELRRLNEETISLALESSMAVLAAKYGDYPSVQAYLQAMQGNLLKTVVEQLVDEEHSDSVRRKLLEEQYSPNVVMGHSHNGGAPVVFEPHPTYDNLFGRIEYSSDQGMLYTSYRQLRPGALHRANGGYLILEAEKLLPEPFVWEALKRALHSRQLKMESPLLELTRMAAVTLTPQVIPLQVKVIVIGSRDLYYALQELDPDFQDMFRVLVDFEEDLPLEQDSLLQFAQLVRNRTSEEGMAPLTRCAVQRLARYSMRLSEHQERLSAHLSELFQVVSEADFLRGKHQDQWTDASHVEQAINARMRRTGRVSRRILDDMLDGVILIDTGGATIGKCNGLTVLQAGDSVFGVPARISATVHPGSNGIVDIEREVTLGQPIHSKGVMILTGYLGSHYAQEYPLAISASIALEQSYGYVDGDSASLGEICALISALARVPLKQCFAITGSINQFGEVQAIGGVNEKIEGFFKLCRERGLTGEQGVIVPRANQKNLLLSDEVIAAVDAGQFSVYVVDHVEQALALLSGQQPGQADEEGHFPDDSINGKVVARLKTISELGAEREEDKGQEPETAVSAETPAP